MAQAQGLIGIFLILLIAFLMSNNRKAINHNTVIWGLILQLSLAILIILTPIGKPFFQWFDTAIKTLIAFALEGTNFLFKSFVPEVGFHVGLINFAFRALPTIIFFSGLMAVMYHLGIIQFIVKWILKNY